MLDRLINAGFDIAVWKIDSSLFVRLRYRNREVRQEFTVGKDTTDEALLKTATTLANKFPSVVDF